MKIINLKIDTDATPNGTQANKETTISSPTTEHAAKEQALSPESRRRGTIRNFLKNS